MGSNLLPFAPSEWQRTTLGKVAVSVQTGPFGSQLHASDYVPFGIPCIMPKDIQDGRVYIHDGNRTFVPCGRYSLDPEFRKKGRQEYSDSQGCINSGWRHGWHFDNQFGNTDAEYKRKCLETYQIPENVYNEIGMKSHLYAVKTLRNRTTDQPVAVIVIEAINRDRFTEPQLLEALNSQERYLADMIVTLSQHIPTPNQARERGF